MKKRNAGRLVLLVLLLCGLVGLLFGEHLVSLYRDLSFRWSDATEAERKV